ncbi:MAG TPA: hypothetical protein VEL07_16405 [Planctomycetota bacterium]|nr:hypothetical protein [Planctomycetota bacterium]
MVDIDDWVVREGDVQRQHELVKVLRIADAPASHIALVEKEIGSVRVRPEEVAGSALVKTPCSMRSAEFAASHILRVAAG